MPERVPLAPVQLTVHSMFDSTFASDFENFPGCDRKAFAKVLHCSNFSVEFRTIVLF
jgi:hypothetical protein